MQQNHKNIKVIQKRYKKRTKKKWDKEKVTYQTLPIIMLKVNSLNTQLKGRDCQT